MPTPDDLTLSYYWSGNLWYVLRTLWFFAVPLWLLSSGRAARLRDAVEARVASPAARAALFIAGFSLIVWLLDRPLAFYLSYLRQHAYGLSNLTIPRYAELALTGFAVRTGVLLVGGSLLFWLLRRFPRRWWAVASVGIVPLAFFMVEVWPVWIEPLFHDFGRMKDRELEARILDLARRSGVPGDQVYEVAKSTDTKATNAYVAGLMGTKRIVLWDTLLERMEPDEVLFVMGHEIGHYALDHMLRGFAMTCLALPLLFFAARWVGERVVDRKGASWGVRDLADPAAWPLHLVVFTALMMVGDPVYLAVSRQVEHDADVFALELTRDNEAAERAYRKLQSHNLAHPDPGPVYRFFRQSHPSIADRIRLARSYRPWETGEPLRYADVIGARPARRD